MLKYSCRAPEELRLQEYFLPGEEHFSCFVSGVTPLIPLLSGIGNSLRGEAVKGDNFSRSHGLS